MAGGRQARWRRFFDDAYFRLHAPLFEDERTRREVAGILELMGPRVGARLLDAPCGWARHATLLAGAGFDVTGVDGSPHLLSRAPESARPRLVAADLRALPFTAGFFDGAYHVSTSLGLFEDDADNVRALEEARRVLVPGGVFLLESMHRDDVVSAYAERDAWTLPDGTEVRVRRRFDPVAGESREILRWRRDDERGEKRHVLRLLTATEIAALLESAGFRDVVWYGDWAGGRLSHRSECVIAVARA